MIKNVKLKNIVISLFIFMCVFTVFAVSAFASVTLKDGKYEVNVVAIHAQTGEISKMNSSVRNPALLEVENGQIFVILEFADSIYDLAVDDGKGSFVKAEVISENEASKTFTYKFNVKSIDEPVLMQTVVAAMGTKVNFKLDFDKNSLADKTKDSTAISSSNESTKEKNNEDKSGTQTKTETTTQKESAANSSIPNPKTGDNTTQASTSILLIIASAFAILFALYRFKYWETSKK